MLQHRLSLHSDPWPQRVSGIGGKHSTEELKELLTSPFQAQNVSFSAHYHHIGPALSQHCGTSLDQVFNPVPYVRLWVAKGHRTANELQTKVQSREENEEVHLWDILNN